MRSPGPLLAVLALAACQSGPPRDAGLADPLPRGAELVPPPDWRTCSYEAFTAWVRTALPEDRATPIEKHAVRELQKALYEVTTSLGGGRHDPLAVRAAVILGRSRHPTSASILIRRLERRVDGPERWSDCGDTVAAAALARFPDPRRYAQRLVPLAVGSRPHPDLEVRVECARSALELERDGAIPFLLVVLRLQTHAGQSDARDFVFRETTAWARSRAAEALSARAGVACTYEADAPIAAREREAARLAARLAAILAGEQR
jgi:hypothetical protein